MINRDMQTVQVVTYTNTDDAYGVPRQTTDSTREIEMAIYDYNHSETNDIRFQEVDKVGLTKDSSLSDKNTICVKNKNIWFVIKYVLPTKRYNVIYLREIK